MRQILLARHGYAIRCFSTKPNLRVFGIRREDINPWERRAPLAPKDIRELLRNHVVDKVIVQPSNRRAYTVDEYQAAGATIQEDMSPCGTIFGVKQVPADLLMANRMYCFFSHTIKAQSENMELLDTVLHKKIRLLDYERLVDGNNNRLVAFGMWAGVTGMINILHGMGLRLLALGHHTPFMHIGPPHNYRNSEMAKSAIRDAGYQIALGRMPASIGPLTFVFTGSGNVSQGAQDVFSELPHEYVEPGALKDVATHGATNKVYATVVGKKDYLERREGGGFDNEEFSAHPELYRSRFALDIAPYSSCIVNGIYWSHGMPRLLTIPEAKAIMRPAQTPWITSSAGCPNLPQRLLAICDISCDPGGSIQFMQQCTSIQHPFCLYDADEHMNTESFTGSGVLVCSIDNMPTQLPREATDFFGYLLKKYVADIMAASDCSTPFEQAVKEDVIKRAIISSDGELTPNYKYIEKLRINQASTSSSQSEGGKKNVLVLGAGYVASPVVEYLTRENDVAITLSSQFMDEANAIASKYPDTTPHYLNVMEQPDDLEKAVKSHDLVISLLPAQFHPQVAKLCVKHKVNMVTASYTSPEMWSLDQEAREAGISIVNEVGLDPGIDHLLAVKCFDEVKEMGGVVKSFVSYCGGLPAPECSDNPLRYRFSWAPRNVLANSTMDCQYLQNGKEIKVPEGGAVLDTAVPIDFLPGFNLEGIPNRDSLKYLKLYDIESATTCFRGTLRYTGFCEIMKGPLKLGFCDTTPNALFHEQGPDITWKGLLCTLVNLPTDTYRGTLRQTLSDKFEGSELQLKFFEDLDLLSDQPVEKRGNPCDTLANLLAKALAYGPGERDMTVLRHNIMCNFGGENNETREYTLVVYGDAQVSAMAKTVGLTAGIAARMVLDAEIQRHGIVVPFNHDIYSPMLRRLQQENIVAREKIVKW